MRGLKLLVVKIKCHIFVASFTDAWIETFAAAKIKAAQMVASFTDAWIETNRASKWTERTGSHLLQMRGLKPPLSMFRTFCRVASFTDAWIETYQFLILRVKFLVASFTDAWIETIM